MIFWERQNYDREEINSFQGPEVEEGDCLQRRMRTLWG